MSSLVKNIIRFVLFIFLQAFVLKEIPPLHRFIVPYLYFLYILWLPFSMNRFLLMMVAFVFGLTLDYFEHTIGIHAAACVLIAYLRPMLLGLLLPQETTELNYEDPSVKSMGRAPYALYIIILTFIHHTYMVLLEWTQFGNFVYFIGKVLGTTAVSLLLIFITEIIFSRKGKYRTNAA